MTVNFQEAIKLFYGVLSHQGAYTLHEEVLKKLNRNVINIFSQDDLDKVDALIIPGGESTTLNVFFDRLDFWDVLSKKLSAGMPVLGTCAGAILLSSEVVETNQRTLGLIDISVERMGFGRQVDSFEAPVDVNFLNGKPLNGVFIRAPRITRVGDNVEVIATLDDEPVAVRSGNVWATTFHPELADDLRFS